jgi:hypothetical protein
MGLASLVLASSWSVAPAIELRWHAPAGCPDATHVTSRLVEYLGQTSVPDVRARVDADVRQLDDGAWELTLRFEDHPDDPRVLTNTSCEGLAEAAVVVVAIAVTPAAAVEEPERAQAPPEPTTTTRPPSKAADGRPEPRVQLSLTALAGVGFGPVPVGFALAPSIAVSSRRWHVGIAAVYEPARSLRLDDLPASGSDLMHWALGPEACWLAPIRSYLSIPLCGGFELGQLDASPVELLEGQRQRSLWAAGIVTAGLRFRVHARVAVWLVPSAVIAFTRSRVVVQGEPSPLFRTAPVGVRGLAGLEVFVW